MQIESGGHPSAGIQGSQEGSCLKGRYILSRALPLAETGFLYAGRDQRTGQPLRIRSLPTGNLNENVRVEMRDAVRRIMTIRRPDYFPRVRDLIETEGGHYLVQEGIEGLTLWDFQNEEAPALPDRFRIAHVFRQVTDRLAYLHDHIQGPILFRDLTPERVIVDPMTRRVRLVDFCLPGMAAGPAEGKPGKGTRQFLAPELYRGESHSILTDVYSLGRLLQFTVFGETGEDPTPSTPIPTAVGRNVPETLRELVQRMIAPDPSLRPQSMAEAKAAFEACLDPSSAPFSRTGAALSREQCPACKAESTPEDICCPHCGAPTPQTAETGDAAAKRSARIHATGLERERFQGLKPVSLERFSLMKMSAQVARFGGYANLSVRDHESTNREDLPLGETLQVLRDLRGRALLVGEDPLRPVRIAETLLAEYRHRGWVNRCLIVAPGNLAHSWQRRLRTNQNLDAEVFDPDGTVNIGALPDRMVLVSSPENLRGQTERRAVLETTWDLVIVDAAHLCTARRSHRWQLLEALRSKYLLLLTPTPIQDDVSDLLTLLRLVRPYLWNSSPQDFRASIDNALPALCDKVERSMVEVEKKNDTPVVQTNYLLTQPEGDAAELYNVILNSLASNDLDSNTTLLIKQALISASPGLLREAAADETAAALIAGVRALLEDERHPKVQQLLTNVAPSIEGKALLFSRDPTLRSQLAELLTKAGVPAVCADANESEGEPPAWQRFVEDEDIRFLVLGDETLCPVPEGVIDSVVFFDLPWEPGIVADRVSRLCAAAGDKREIKALQLLAPGTVEEWLYDLYQDCLNVYTPSSPMLYAFQAATHGDETFKSLVEEVAAAGIKGCHGTNRAQNIRERVTGIRDHVETARNTSEKILRLFRRKGAR